MLKRHYRAPLLLALCTILAFAGCSAQIPAPAAELSSVRAADPLIAARAYGVHDARIGRLLAPVQVGGGSADTARGFDQSRVSYGYRKADSSAVALRMPAMASDARYQIQFTPLGALPASAAEVREGIVTYREGYTDTDVLASVGRGAGELLYLLRSQAAPRTYAWKVQLPDGVAKVESRNDGIWFLDSAGDLVVHVPEPYAVDAVGIKRTALLEWDDASREMRVSLTSDTGLTYPILLDPTFETEVWVELQSPPPHSSAQLLHDPVRKRTVLFGGTIPVNETWLWDGLNWQKRLAGRGEAQVPRDAVAIWDPKRAQVLAVGATTATFDGTSWQSIPGVVQPPARTSAHLAWDEAREQVVLFGGTTRDGVVADTWLYNGQQWLPFAPAGGAKPDARLRASMLWDPVRKKVVLYGGLGLTGNLGDTWVYDSVSWSKVVTPAAATPPARYGQVAAWDPVQSQIVLFGGFTSTYVNDTWLFNGLTWTKFAAPAGSVPPPLYNSRMVWDAVASQLMLFAGQTLNAQSNDAWRFNAAGWTRAPGTPPPARIEHSMAWDSTRGEVLVVGGSSPTAQLRDTWRYSSTAASWRLVGAARGLAPAGRAGHTMTWDADSQNVLLFGGQNLRGFPAGTWLFDGGSWALSPARTPVPRAMRPTIQEATRGAVPSGFPKASAADRPRGSEYDLNRDKPTSQGVPLVLQPSETRSLTELPSDPATRTLLLFGGTSDLGRLGDTWLWSSQRWNQVAAVPPNAPAPREQHEISWDPVRKKFWLFGGASDNGMLADTWGFDGLRWALVLRIGEVPTGRVGHSLVWDPRMQRTVLFGGYSEVGYERDTWAFDGVNWKNVSADSLKTPPQRSEHVMLLDAAQNVFVLFGGNGVNGLPQADTWFYDGKEWTAGDPASPATPAGRSGHSLTWDSIRQRVVLFGGRTSSNELDDAWVLEGRSWRPLLDRNGVGPSARTNHTMVFDPIRKRFVLFGGQTDYSTYPDDTWLLYLRGGGCGTRAECATGFCTDGVCCESEACGTCATCAGASPGKCTTLTSVEDPDSCALKDKKSCDARGACVPGLGATCTKGADCATGFCADGICCDTACDGACRSCKGAENVDGVSGRCGPSKAGSNPGSKCTDGAVCGASGTCDRGATCKDDRTALDGKGQSVDCANYKCKGGVCPGVCADVSDCNAPAVCTQDGKCTAPTARDDAGSGCCAAAPRHSESSAIGAISAVIVLILALARPRRKGK
jgi:hypothetical protein